MSQTNFNDNDLYDDVVITQNEDFEWEIDIRNCHGLGMKTGEFENPYDAAQIAVTGMGSTRGVIANSIEEVLSNAGSFSGVGSKMAFKVVGAIPDAALNIVISVKEEGILQASISSGVGVAVSIAVTTIAGGSGVLAPIAPIIGAIAGDFANGATDCLFESVFGSGKQNDQNTALQLYGNEPTVKYDPNTGELFSNLPDSVNQAMITELLERGQPVYTIEKPNSTYEWNHRSTSQPFSPAYFST